MKRRKVISSQAQRWSSRWRSARSGFFLISCAEFQLDCSPANEIAALDRNGVAGFGDPSSCRGKVGRSLAGQWQTQPRLCRARAVEGSASRPGTMVASGCASAATVACARSRVAPASTRATSGTSSSSYARGDPTASKVGLRARSAEFARTGASGAIARRRHVAAVATDGAVGDSGPSRSSFLESIPALPPSQLEEKFLMGSARGARALVPGGVRRRARRDHHDPLRPL